MLANTEDNIVILVSTKDEVGVYRALAVWFAIHLVLEDFNEKQIENILKYIIKTFEKNPSETTKKLLKNNEINNLTKIKTWILEQKEENSDLISWDKPSTLSIERIANVIGDAFCELLVHKKSDQDTDVIESFASILKTKASWPGFLTTQEYSPEKPNFAIPELTLYGETPLFGDTKISGVYISADTAKNIEKKHNIKLPTLETPKLPLFDRFKLFLKSIREFFSTPKENRVEIPPSTPTSSPLELNKIETPPSTSAQPPTEQSFVKEKEAAAKVIENSEDELPKFISNTEKKEESKKPDPVPSEIPNPKTLLKITGDGYCLYYMFAVWFGYYVLADEFDSEEKKQSAEPILNAMATYYGNDQLRNLDLFKTWLEQRATNGILTQSDIEILLAPPLFFHLNEIFTVNESLDDLTKISAKFIPLFTTLDTTLEYEHTGSGNTQHFNLKMPNDILTLLEDDNRKPIIQINYPTTTETPIPQFITPFENISRASFFEKDVKKRNELLVNMKLIPAPIKNIDIPPASTELNPPSAALPPNLEPIPVLPNPQLTVLPPLPASDLMPSTSTDEKQKLTLREKTARDILIYLLDHKTSEEIETKKNHGLVERVLGQLTPKEKKHLAGYGLDKLINSQTQSTKDFVAELKEVSPKKLDKRIQRYKEREKYYALFFNSNSPNSTQTFENTVYIEKRAPKSDRDAKNFYKILGDAQISETQLIQTAKTLRYEYLTETKNNSTYITIKGLDDPKKIGEFLEIFKKNLKEEEHFSLEGSATTSFGNNSNSTPAA